MEMETDHSITSKRFRSEDSSINTNSTLSDELLSCPFCTFHTNTQIDFDFHNHIHHQHICSQCLHIFPSYFLLDLHMDEAHNNYSTIRSYRCLIESCTNTFSNIEQRLQHINTEHYTKNRYLNDIFLLFSNEEKTQLINKEQEKKFGCDSQKTFLRNSRLKPRQFLNTHWDGDE